MRQGADQTSDLTIRPEEPSRPDVIVLLRKKDEAHSAQLYPTESDHHLPAGSV